MSGSIQPYDTAGSGYGQLNINGSVLITPLQQLLLCDQVVPGSAAGYQVCKEIYIYHPLGGKMVDSPISKAQSQERKIIVSDAPEERVAEAFQKEWVAIHADDVIAQFGGIARTYGIAGLILGAEGVDPNTKVDPEKYNSLKLYFNVLDPLNTSGSLVLSQDPNSPDFQKYTSITSQGITYHRSRCLVLMNEKPIYIAFTTSAFGFVGRSVYQRALFPLKSFIQTMITDDMVSLKAGVIVAKMKPPGGWVDNIMRAMAGLKRALIKEAQVGNVLTITPEEDIESLNLQNIDKAMDSARKHILDNIATAADMPAKFLQQETFAEGFGEGTEDAKAVSDYIDKIRIWLQPAYEFFDKIVQRRAWNEDFYRAIQADFPEWRNVSYQAAFYRWQNSFEASWPSLIKEPESEKAKVDDIKLKAVIAIIETLFPNLDPDNKALLVQWAQDNINENKTMFSSPLELDIEALKNYEPPQPMMGGADEMPAEPKPFSNAA